MVKPLEKSITFWDGQEALYTSYVILRVLQESSTVYSVRASPAIRDPPPSPSRRTAVKRPS